MTNRIRLAGLIFAVLFGVISPPPAPSQPLAKAARIGYLSLESQPAQFLAAFQDGLQRLGYVDGGSMVIESRLAEGKAEKLPALASELVALKLDVIVGADGGSARALSRATKTIPIVMGVSGDPVELGLAISLARPGGNVTGLTFPRRNLRANDCNSFGRLPRKPPRLRFELVINLRTAKALGVTMPASLLLQADHVIE